MNLASPELTRRRFLASATAGTLAAFTGFTAFHRTEAVAAEEAKPAHTSFGFSLYGMRSLKLADAVKACAEIGYDSVELVANAGWPCDPEKFSDNQRRQLRAVLNDHGLSVCGIMENLPLAVGDPRHRQNLDRLKAAAELGHAITPGSIPVIETVLGGRPADWEKLRGPMAKRLQDWAKVAEDTRSIIAIKAHVGGALHTPEDAVWLMQQAKSPGIRLTYDYSHFQLWDFDLEESLKPMLPSTVFVHIKDSRGQRGGFRFLLPGEGSQDGNAIDYTAYFSMLRSSGYTGPVCVEVSGQIHGQKGYDPIAAAKTSYTNIAPALEQAGLRPRGA